MRLRFLLGGIVAIAAILDTGAAEPNHLKADDLLRMLQVSSDALQNIDVKYSYAANPLDGCDDFFLGHQIIRELKGGVHSQGFTKYRTLPHVKYKESFLCTLLSDFKRRLFFYDDIGRKQIAPGHVSLVGGILLYADAKHTAGELYGNWIETMPLYDDLIRKIPPYVPYSMQAFPSMTNPTIIQWITRARDSGIIEITSQSHGILIVNTLYPLDNQLYANATLHFNLSFGAIPTRIELHANQAHRKGFEVDRIPANIIEYHDFREVSNHTWLPMRITATACSRLSAYTTELSAQQKVKAWGDNFKDVLGKPLNVMQHQITVQDVVANKELSDNDFKLSFKTGARILNRQTQLATVVGNLDDPMATELNKIIRIDDGGKTQ